MIGSEVFHRPLAGERKQVEVTLFYNWIVLITTQHRHDIMQHNTYTRHTHTRSIIIPDEHTHTHTYPLNTPPSLLPPLSPYQHTHALSSHPLSTPPPPQYQHTFSPSPFCRVSGRCQEEHEHTNPLYTSSQHPPFTPPPSPTLSTHTHTHTHSLSPPPYQLTHIYTHTHTTQSQWTLPRGT